MTRRAGSKAAVLALDGATIQRLRAFNRLSQGLLGKRASLSKATISLVESNKTLVSESAAISIAAALDVSVAAISPRPQVIQVPQSSSSLGDRNSLLGLRAHLIAAVEQIDQLLAVENSEAVARLYIAARDRPRLVHDIARMVFEAGLNIRAASTYRLKRAAGPRFGSVDLTVDRLYPNWREIVESKLRNVLESDGCPEIAVEPMGEQAISTNVLKVRRHIPRPLAAAVQLGIVESAERNVVPIGSPGLREVTVAVLARDRPGLLLDITEVVSGRGINISALGTSTTEDAVEKRATIWFAMPATGSLRLQSIEDELWEIRDVERVYVMRATGQPRIKTSGKGPNDRPATLPA